MGDDDDGSHPKNVIFGGARRRGSSFVGGSSAGGMESDALNSRKWHLLLCLRIDSECLILLLQLHILGSVA
jgi:hypothetical protein